MFSFRLKDITVMLIKTLIFVFILDFISSSLLPTFHQSYIFPSFHLLIIIYLSFYMPPNILPFLILIIQGFHSLFTSEGWAIGTINSCLISYFLVMMRDTIQFSSYFSTFFLVYGVQVVWSVINGFLLSLKVDNWQPLELYFRFSLTQGLILALIALPVFRLLQKIWVKEHRESLGFERTI